MFVFCVSSRLRSRLEQEDTPPPNSWFSATFVVVCVNPGRLQHLLASLPPQDWPFDDGAPPSNQIVDDWLNLLKLKFREEPGCCVAVHCVAGLGR